MKSHSVIFFLLFTFFHVGSTEKGCPDRDDITPCVCYDSPDTDLQCENILDVETLRRVFVNSARYRYNEVHIECSSLQYLPHDIFESATVNEIYLKNVTLSQLFDSPLEAQDQLQKLSIESSVVLRGILWELLKPLKGLKFLEIYLNSIKTIGKDFIENAPKGLEQVSFYKTEIKTIQSGAFEEFTKLDKLQVDYSKLTKLSRDILPIPFNGRNLQFNNNQLTEIADDMFTQMPNLQNLGLNDNQIATIPESAFEGTGGASQLGYLLLLGNPIKCDCRILWLIQNKPPSLALAGSCESPKNLHGQEIRLVSPSDLNC